MYCILQVFEEYKNIDNRMITYKIIKNSTKGIVDDGSK